MTEKASSPISPLYSRYLSPQERKSLRQVPLDDISSEINLLRSLSGLFMKIQKSAPRDLFSRMLSLRTCALLCDQLAILVRFHDKGHGPSSLMDDILFEALKGLPMHEPDPESDKNV